MQGAITCHFCGHALYHENKKETNVETDELYLTKLISLFTFYAFAIAAATIFYTVFGESITKNMKIIPPSFNYLEPLIPWTISLIFGFVMVEIYLFTSSWAIKKSIDKLLQDRK